MDMTQSPVDYAALAATLDQSDDFRVLRRFREEDFPVAVDVPPQAGIVVILDTETTGREAADKIIELGMVSVAYNKETGELYGALGTFSALEDPGMPIPPKASAVNGITDEMVRGKRISDEAVRVFVAQADLVIAHNSEFDRPKTEARFPFFANLPWACSFRQMDWDSEGIGSAKLDYIAFRKGFFFDGHRSTIDCLALGHILSMPMTDGRTGLQALLARGMEVTHRVWATNSPFEKKDTLKARGYRWSAGDRPGMEKAWYTDVSAEAYPEELAWLKADIYGGRSVALPVDFVDAYKRFSERQGKRERIYL